MKGSWTVAVLLALAPSASGQVVKILNDFPDSVECLAFSPDSKTLATSTHPSAGDNNALRLWDLASSKELCCLGNYRQVVGGLTFAPDGKTLVCRSRHQTLDLWDVATRKVRLVIKTKPGIGAAAAISRDSRLLAAAGYGEQANVWDLRTGKEVAALGPREVNIQSAGGRCTSIVFAPNGKLLATSKVGGGVALWDVASGKRRADLGGGHQRTVYNVAFAPDGKTLYSLGQDRLLIYWDVATGKERRRVDLSQQINYIPTETALSPDGTMLAVLAANHVRLLNLKKGAFRADVDWQYQDGEQWCIAFSPDGKLLATGAGSNRRTNTVYLWKVPAPRTKPPR